MTITFPYDDWTRDDIQLDRPGSTLGLAVVRGSLPIGKAPTKRVGDNSDQIGPALDATIELLAGSLEWLREYGMPETEVRSRVLSFMSKNRATTDQRAINNSKATAVIADPQNLRRRLSPDSVIRTYP